MILNTPQKTSHDLITNNLVPNTLGNESSVSLKRSSSSSVCHQFEKNWIFFDKAIPILIFLRVKMGLSDSNRFIPTED